MISALVWGCLNTGSGQTGQSAFGVLDTVNYVPQNCSSTVRNGIATYQVNGVTTDSLRHSQCLDNRQLMSYCLPCWSRAYNEEGELLFEAAAYSDCLIGEYRAYYPSGKLKFKGHFSSDAVRDSTGKVRPTSCGIKNGEWVYYNEAGNIDYEEIWRNGRFREQIPNQGVSEVWAIDLTFFGGKFDPQDNLLRFDMINKLTIQPLYKNANRRAEVKGVLEISCPGYPVKKVDFTPTSFPYLDLNNLLPEGDDWKREDLSVDLKFYIDGDYSFAHRLKVY